MPAPRRLDGRVRHPWWQERALRGARTRRAWTAGMAAVAVVAMLGAGRSAPVGQAVSDRADLVGLAAFVLASAVARVRSRTLGDALLHGWWRAAPVDAGSVPRAVARMAALDGLSILIVATAMLLAARLAGAGAETGVIAGTAGALTGIAIGTVLGWRARSADASLEGVRHPLWRMALPLDARAPHLADWQRRETVLRWRRDGNVRVVGAMLALVPASGSPRTLAGALVLCATAAWLGTAWHASAQVAREAAASMAALPCPAFHLRRAALRYPLAATGVAMAWALVALALAPALAPTLPGWIALVLAVALRGGRRPRGHGP